MKRYFALLFLVSCVGEPFQTLAFEVSDAGSPEVQQRETEVESASDAGLYGDTRFTVEDSAPDVDFTLDSSPDVADAGLVEASSMTEDASKDVAPTYTCDDKDPNKSCYLAGYCRSGSWCCLLEKPNECGCIVTGTCVPF